MPLRSSKIQREKLATGFGNMMINHRRISDMEKQNGLKGEQKVIYQRQ